MTFIRPDGTLDPRAFSWFPEPAAEPVHPVEPLTEQLPAVPAATPPAAPVAGPTRLVTEEEHRAALAEIDLPCPPARWVDLGPSPWTGVRIWVVQVLQLALGAAVGAALVLMLLWYAAWLVR